MHAIAGSKHRRVLLEKVQDAWYPLGRGQEICPHSPFVAVLGNILYYQNSSP